MVANGTLTIFNAADIKLLVEEQLPKYFLTLRALFEKNYNESFRTQHSSYSLEDLDNFDRYDMNNEEFNALDDLSGAIQEDEALDDENELMRDREGKLQINYKKSNLKPKYDPGWKFIGLGKRLTSKQVYTNGNDTPRDQEELPYDSSYPKDNAYLSFGFPKTKVGPLLTFSTLINFEIFNAIKDGIEQAAKETVKKGEGIHPSKLFQGDNGNSNKFGSRLSMYNGKKVMYDPGWMLTGLGK
ncbi:uncharacterized protein NPIL_532661 [Nephila pilipes]|uniref:Uncharacterized protein n=1 Tax=Nephila pilipes TaxID=299642 RepID=A0A8X6QK24_NEPPI|nr:uncharacterized protein NPIL_532661 [Nephila pilipes]